MVPIAALSQVSSIIEGARDLVALVRSGSTNSSPTASSTEDKRLQTAFSTLMKEMDANNDGILSKVEFGGEKSTFDKLDLNHNGQLDAAEVQQMFAQRLNARTATATASSQPTLSVTA